MIAGGVEGAVANETILVIKVDRDMATVMRTKARDTERLILAWMRGWKELTGRSAVTVTVQSGTVEIAKGQTGFSGDRVTIRQ